jgi:glycerol-3-phosphate dehydrogenase
MAEETLDQVSSYLGGASASCTTAVEPLLDAAEVSSGSGVLPPPVSRDVVAHACRSEWARHLDDVMSRRTSWRHYHRDHLALAAEVAEWMADELSWSDADKVIERHRYQQLAGGTI